LGTYDQLSCRSFGSGKWRQSKDAENLISEASGHSLTSTYTFDAFLPPKREVKKSVDSQAESYFLSPTAYMLVVDFPALPSALK
jgi:hypothetical protein